MFHAKIPVRKELINKIEKEKKERSVGIALTDKAKKSFEIGKPIAGMAGQESNVLLKYFNEPNLTQGRVNKIRNCLKNIGWWKSESSCSLWAEKEEIELVLLKTEPSSIQDTAIVWLKSSHKSEIKATFRAMPKRDFIMCYFILHAIVNITKQLTIKSCG